MKYFIKNITLPLNIFLFKHTLKILNENVNDVSFLYSLNIDSLLLLALSINRFINIHTNQKGSSKEGLNTLPRKPHSCT
jgi:hypothetical protein